MKVRKDTLPVGGMDTRFLPATKAIPKEHIPVIDKPVLQYVFEAAAAAGIAEVVQVARSSNSLIESYFSANVQLESYLRQSGRDDLLAVFVPAEFTALIGEHQ